MVEIPTYNEIATYFIEQFKTNEFFATAGVFGVLGIIWSYFKGVPILIWQRVRRKIIYTAHIEEVDNFYEYFEEWLNLNHNKSYRNVQVTSSDSLHDGDEEEEALRRIGIYRDGKSTDVGVKSKSSLKLKQFEDLFYIRRGLTWVRVLKNRERLENANSLKSAFYNNFELSALFGKKAILSIMNEVIEYKLEQDSKWKFEKIEVWTNDSDYWRKERDYKPKPLDYIFIENKESIVQDIKEFIGSKEWYHKRGLAHKRGYMFYGKPGTGKTTLALALAKHFNKNIFVLNPRNLKDSDLRELFRELRDNSILLIEDIDAIFTKDRKEKDNKVIFNFSTFLNCLDGVFSKDNLITIFTTNFPERLDDALIREGRVDYRVEITYPKVELINHFLNNFYKEVNNPLPEDLEINLSMAKIQEICIKNKFNPKRAVDEILKIRV